MKKQDPITTTSARVLQQGRIRFSIKLESVFWGQLEEIAADQGTTLTKLVHSVLKDLPSSENKTSALRVYCQITLQKKIEDAHYGARSSIWGVVLTASPTPILIISTNRKITAYNQAFKIGILEGLTTSLKGKPGKSPHLTFSQPFNRIVSYLNKNPTSVVKSQIGVFVGTQARHCRVRFAFIDEEHVMVFVETH